MKIQKVATEAILYSKTGTSLLKYYATKMLGASEIVDGIRFHSTIAAEEQRLFTHFLEEKINTLLTCKSSFTSKGNS